MKPEAARPEGVGPGLVGFFRKAFYILNMQIQIQDVSNTKRKSLQKPINPLIYYLMGHDFSFWEEKSFFAVQLEKKRMKAESKSVFQELRFLIRFN